MRTVLPFATIALLLCSCASNTKVEESVETVEINTEELLAYANEQYEQANYDSSIYYLSKINKLDSQNFDATLLEGDVRWAQRNFDASMAAYTTCLKMDEAKPVVWARLGKIYLEQNDQSSALKYFNQAINLDPTYADAYIGRAMSFMAKEETEQAFLSLQTALDFDPDNYNGWLRMAKWRMAQEDEIAIQCYSNALRVDSSDAAVFVERGYANFMFDYRNKAARDYKKGIALDAENLQAHFNLAYLLSEDEEYEEALESFKACTTLNAEDTDAWLGRAICEKELGNKANAEEALKKILEIDPNDPDASRELQNLQ